MKVTRRPAPSGQFEQNRERLYQKLVRKENIRSVQEIIHGTKRLRLI